MNGSIRVVNYRKDMAPEGSLPEPHEIVVPVDRSNPILGNKHILRNKLDRNERLKVIAEFTNDLEHDFAVQGLMYKAINDLAERVLSGEQICLQCACKPLNCHGDVIAEKVRELVLKKRLNHDSP